MFVKYYTDYNECVGAMCYSKNLVGYLALGGVAPSPEAKVTKTLVYRDDHGVIYIATFSGHHQTSSALLMFDFLYAVRTGGNFPQMYDSISKLSIEQQRIILSADEYTWTEKKFESFNSSFFGAKLASDCSPK